MMKFFEKLSFCNRSKNVEVNERIEKINDSTKSSETSAPHARFRAPFSTTDSVARAEEESKGPLDLLLPFLLRLGRGGSS